MQKPQKENIKWEYFNIGKISLGHNRVYIPQWAEQFLIKFQAPETKPNQLINMLQGFQKRIA